MVSFQFTVENQTEEDYTMNLTSISPPAGQYNPQPSPTIDDGDDDDFGIADGGNELVSTFKYRLDDENGVEVGTYNFIFRFHNGQLIHEETHTTGLDIFINIQDNGNNNFGIDITCQLEAESE